MRDVAAEREVELTFPGGFEPLEDDVLHAGHVRRIVISARLQHRARGGDGVAAALHLDGVEERAIRHVVVGIDLGPDDVAGLEVDTSIRPRANGPQVRRRFTRATATVRLEHVARNDHADAAERRHPERRGRLERELERVAVHSLRALDRLQAHNAGRGRRRIHHVLPVEDDVVRRERLAVVPRDATLETPRHGAPVAGEQAVGDCRDVLSEHGDEVPVAIV